MRDGGDFTVFDESAGRRALLRVPARCADSSFTYAKRITRLIRRGCG